MKQIILIIFFILLASGIAYAFDSDFYENYTGITSTNTEREIEIGTETNKPIIKYNFDLSETCLNGKCIITIGGQIYADENGTKIEDAKSLKDCQYCGNVKLDIQEDKTNFPVRIIDYNYTKINICFSAGLTQLNKEIPLTIYKKDDAISTSLTSSINLKTIFNEDCRNLDLGFDNELKYGDKSTIIKLQVTGNESLGMASFYSSNRIGKATSNTYTTIASTVIVQSKQSYGFETPDLLQNLSGLFVYFPKSSYGGNNITKLEVSINNCMLATTLTPYIYDGTTPSNIWFIGTPINCISNTRHTLNMAYNINWRHNTTIYVGFRADSNITMNVDTVTESQDWYYNISKLYTQNLNRAYPMNISTIYLNTSVYIKFNTTYLNNDITKYNASLCLNQFSGSTTQKIKIYLTENNWNQTTLNLTTRPNRLTNNISRITASTIAGFQCSENITSGINFDKPTSFLLTNASGTSNHIFYNTNYSANPSLRPKLLFQYNEIDAERCTAITSQNTQISTDTILCQRRYNISNTRTVINITANNIILNCNSSTINASGTHIIYGLNRNNVTIKNCNIIGGFYSINFQRSSNITIYNINQTNSTYLGLLYEHGRGGQFNNINISNTSYSSFYITNATKINLRNSHADGGTGAGYDLPSTSYSNYTNLKAFDVGVAMTMEGRIEGSTISWSRNNYVYNLTGYDIYSSNANGKGISSSYNNNSIIRNCLFYNLSGAGLGNGIYADRTTFNNTFSNITVHDSTYGIENNGNRNRFFNNYVYNTSVVAYYIFYSNYSQYYNNIAFNNTIGFYLNVAVNNTLINNTARNNTDSGLRIYTKSINNTLINFISKQNQAYGLELYNSSNNTIKNSKFSVNSVRSIRLVGNPRYNHIFNNLFNDSLQYLINSNTPNYFNTTSQTGTRIFTSGTNIGGNCYTNRTLGGYCFTCDDSDNNGFCDTPLSLGTGAVDNLPLSDEYLEGLLSCVCPDPQSQWLLDFSDNCDITNCDIGNYNIITTGTGNIRCMGNITAKNLSGIDNLQTLYVFKNCTMKWTG